MKKLIVFASTVLAASVSFAGGLNCAVSEVIAGSYFSRPFMVQENSTEFLTLLSKTTKGFVSYSNGMIVINLYDVNEMKAKYVVEPASQGQVSMTFAPEHNPQDETTVACQAQ